MSGEDIAEVNEHQRLKHLANNIRDAVFNLNLALHEAHIANLQTCLGMSYYLGGMKVEVESISKKEVEYF